MNVTDIKLSWRSRFRIFFLGWGVRIVTDNEGTRVSIAKALGQ